MEVVCADINNRFTEYGSFSAAGGLTRIISNDVVQTPSAGMASPAVYIQLQVRGVELQREG